MTTITARIVLLAALLLPEFALAQYAWENEGVPVRQGAHLGWNGTLISAGNDVAAFYYDCTRDGMRDVLGQRIAPDGTRRWDVQGILISGNISEQRAPVAAAYSDGSVLVVWEDYATGRYRDLVAQRYSQSGEPLWSPATGVIIVAADRDQYDVHLTIDENDVAYAVYTDDRRTTGPEALIDAYGQVIQPDGSISGPQDGIQLVDRSDYYNGVIDVVAVNGAAYALVTTPLLGNFELVLQKLNPDGTISWPNDEPVGPPVGYGEVHLAKLEDALAISWIDRTNDSDGDAYLLALDLNGHALAGWPETGLLVADGDQAQAIEAISETPDGDLLLAVSDYLYDPDDATLAFYKYSRAGAQLWGPVEFGAAALRSSPLDIAWDGSDAIVSYVEVVSDDEVTARTQKLSASGAKLWGGNGNAILSRTGKALRCDLEKPATAPARLSIIIGRTVSYPETLLIGELSASGSLAGDTEFLAGGITHDIHDQTAARIAEDRLLVAWSDARDLSRKEVYYQILDGQGNTLLEKNGRRMDDPGDEWVSAPPALIADGSGGAYVAWGVNAQNTSNYLLVQRIDAAGNQLWGEPLRWESPQGYEGKFRFVPDDNDGVYLAYSRFTSSFVTRPGVVHVQSDGTADWPAPVEFDSEPGTDATLYAAVRDGQGGIVISASTGPWSDTDITLFHLNSAGQPGSGWTMDGITLGAAGPRDRHPELVYTETGIVLTWERTTDWSSYSLHGAKLTADGQFLWGGGERAMTSDAVVALDHKLAADNTGGFLITWEDFRTGDYVQVFTQRFDAAGNPRWAGDGSLVCDYPSEIGSPAVCHDENGGAWVMWEDLRNADEYGEIDLFATHLSGATGEQVSALGFAWPPDGEAICDAPTYQMDCQLIPWTNGSVAAVWLDQRSSNPGRCCGAGAVGDIFNNVYAQVLTEASLAADDPHASEVVPTNFGISAIYPNPFNPTTQIQFNLPAAADIELALFNMLGQQVKVLRAGRLGSGLHTVEWNASRHASGLYFARLTTASGLADVRKLTLLK